MKTFSLTNPPTSDHRLLDRLTRLMLFAVLGLTLVFGAYYVWDRYVHPGDMSPVELGIAHLESVVQADPADQNARLSLIQFYIDSQDYPAAIEQAQQVLNAYPDDPGALLLLGIAYTKTGQSQLAVDVLDRFVSLRRAVQDIPMDTVLETSLFYIGQNYLALNQPVKAIDALSQALQVDPTDADAMYLLGNAYFLVGQYQPAVDIYLETIRFVPDFTEAYQGLSQCYQALGQPELQAYAQGMQAFSLKDYKKARQILEAAALKLPDFPLVFLGLGLTYEQLGEIQLAQENIERVLALDPTNVTAQGAQVRLQSTNK